MPPLTPRRARAAAPLLGLALAAAAVPLAGAASAAPAPATRAAASSHGRADTPQVRDPFTVLSLVTRSDGSGGLLAYGEARNDGTEAASATFAVDFKDASGAVVDTKLADGDLRTLPTGGTTPFAASTSKAATSAVARPYDTGAEEHPQVRALDVTSAAPTVTDPGTSYAETHYSGTVTNRSPRPVSFVEVLLPFRDGSGQLQSYVTRYAVGSGDLAPGASTTWSYDRPTGLPGTLAQPVGYGDEPTSLRGYLSVTYDTAAYVAGRYVLRATLYDGSFHKQPGAALQLLRRPAAGGAQVAVAQATTGGDGTATFTAPVVGGLYYTIRYAGDAGHAPSDYPDLYAPVRPTVKASAPRTVAHGRAFTVSGSVTPPLAGEQVRVEQLVGKRWVSVSRAARLGGNGRYSIKVTLKKAGTVKLRVESTSSVRSGSISPTLTLRVR